MEPRGTIGQCIRVTRHWVERNGKDVESEEVYIYDGKTILVQLNKQHTLCITWFRSSIH